MMLNIVPTKQEAVCPQQVPVTMETAPSTDYNNKPKPEAPPYLSVYTRDARVKLDRGPNFFQVRPEGAGLHFRTEKTKH